MERKIGEIFEFGGEWYQCVGGTCRDCSFYYDTVCKNIATIGSTNFGNCHCSLRTDHKSVIFKKLEKVGEPYRRWLSPFNYIMVQRYRLYGRNVIMPDEPIMLLEPNYKNSVEIEIKQIKEDMEEKKLNLKPFNLEAAKQGKPVCTRDGRKARIICFDRRLFYKNVSYPILALVEHSDGEDDVCCYNEKGKVLIEDGAEYKDDLMMLPEKKEGWVNVYKERCYESKEEAISCRACNMECIDTIRLEWEE